MKSSVRRRFDALSWIWIAATCAAVFIIGAMTDPTMVGDEVIHYFYAKNLVSTFPEFNAHYIIPVNWSSDGYERLFDRAFGWHVMAAWVLALFKSNVWLQFFNTLFLFEFLAFFHLITIRYKSDPRVSFLMDVFIYSFPAFLLYGTIYYQDLIVIAQIAAAGYFISTKRHVAGLLFWLLAIAVKDSFVMTMPVMVIWLIIAERRSLKRLCRWVFTYLAASFVFILILDYIIYYHTGMRHSVIFMAIKHGLSYQLKEFTPEQFSDNPYSGANCPGNLIYLKNWAIYTGVVFWVAFIAAVAATRTRYRRIHKRGVWRNSGFISFFFATLFITQMTIMLHPFYDIRYFFQGIPFVIYSVVFLARKILLRPICFWGVTALALAQIAFVEYNILLIRTPSAELKETLEFFKENTGKNETLEGRKVLMYPEANFRFFPLEVVWANVHIEMEKASPEQRPDIIIKHNISYVVVKKYLLNDADNDLDRLTGFSRRFVREIVDDPLLTVVFENRQFIVLKFQRNNNDKVN